MQGQQQPHPAWGLPGAAVPRRLHTPEAQPVAWWKVQLEAERLQEQQQGRRRRKDGGRRRGRRRGRREPSSSSGSSSYESDGREQRSEPPLSQARLEEMAD